MKFTVVFVLVACLQVKASTYAQNVSLNVRNASLELVFKEFKKQTGYNFFYNDAMVRTGIPVTLDLKSMPLEEALKQALLNQPLTFSIVNKTVVLKDKMATPDFTSVPAPPEDLHGRVADSLGNPLIGATVRVKGTKEVVITDGGGMFILKNVDDKQTLIVSFTGYVTKEVPVKEGNSRVYMIRLLRSNNPLDEVQVIAYGTNTRRFNVGNVATVTSADIKSSGATNITNALNGRVPGLEVNVFSGVPGARQTFQSRGQNTLSSSASAIAYDQPLIIVDGIPLPTQNNDISMLLNSFNSGGGASGFSALNGLNPSDIESISVLKDADATSIYGSQGANGVVVITTKKGKPGRNRVNVSVVTGPSKISRGLDMMDTKQYLRMRHQAITMDSITTFPTDQSYFKDLFVYDTTMYTDFVKKYYGGTANSTDAHLSMSGGATNSTYMVSAGYTRQSYNMPGDFSDKRYTLHSALSTHSSNNKIRADFGSDVSYETNNSSGSTTLGKAMMTVPDHPDMLDAKGNLVWTYKGQDVSSDQLLAEQKKPYNINSYLFNNYLRLTYEIIPGLNIAANAGWAMNMTKQYSATPLAAVKPGNGTSASANFGQSNDQTINVEPQVDYRKTIGDGELTILAGGTYRKVTSGFNQQLGTGYTDDGLLGTIMAATGISVSDGADISKYVAGFGRINYVYKEKYIVNLTGRRDGSSNFGPGRRFGNFGAVGIGWIISEERFMKSFKPVLSFAKISGNYGTNGSDGVAPYKYQPYWKVASTTSTQTFDGTRPYTASNLYNPNYSWASKHSINLGLDLGFIDDKILLNLAYYRSRTGNQLTGYTLPTQTGFNSVVMNMDAVLQDAGLELSITTRNITTKDFRWTTSFNISGNRNKLISFPGLATSAYAATYAVGKSTSMIYGFKSAGVNDTTGVFQYYKANGTITSAPATSNIAKGGDMQAIANAQTDFYGGLNNTFSYKNWNLSLFFKFSRAMAKNYLAGINYASPLPGGQINLPAFMQDMFWTKPGDHAQLQRLTTGYYGAARNGQLAQRYGSYFTSSDAVYSNNTYLRLKSLMLSYSLPTATVKKMGIQGCSFNITAQNLFTITNYKFGDPEMPGTLYTVPMQLIVTGGFNLEF
ncbi:SusC/RagA family TonB-linked outer membrane protein [Chitinophaga sancti]|uniref:SusC/RagA family TonB-linked outer membrane protein n=1 Tax=Chitinophaga sancti TaxID=1004 RepID=UPI002A754809|nr:SusC/RagA family TonB-linked outer membrane protein [Chitinophaga sancti]WPQ65267.1 SusC/RagA family TonB-linked outer membrane protein [Chitinophaga sancti]